MFGLILATGAICSVAALLASQGFSLSTGISAEARTIPAPSNAVPTSVTEKSPRVAEISRPTESATETGAQLTPTPTIDTVAEETVQPDDPTTETDSLDPTPVPATTLAVERLSTNDVAVVSNLPEKAAALVAAMNVARAAEGLPLLEVDGTLQDVALSRARSLVNENYFAHYGPNGDSAFSELAARGIPYSLAGENLARNNYVESRTLDAAFHGLMASPGHRANILEPQFARVGVAAVQTGRMWIYVTVFMN